MDGEEFVEVKVLVPRSQVSALQRLAADLVDLADRENGAREGDGQRASNAGMRHRFRQPAVRRAYHGGTSEVWSRFLERMAFRVLNPGDEEDPDTEGPADDLQGSSGGVWVSLAALRSDLGAEPSSMAGMIGAAEKRLKSKPPYTRHRWDKEVWYWMPFETAKFVLKAAAPDADAEI